MASRCALALPSARRSRNARLEDCPSRRPAPGELLVRVRPAAINYPDVLIIEDKYQLRPPRPFAPGSEIAGEVEAVGEGVEGWSAGDRLIAAHRLRRAGREGRHSRRGGDPAAGRAQLRGRLGAAADLCDRDPRAARSRQAEAGQTLLVLGAAGGVGIAAVEIGKAVGARVIAAASSEAKAAAAREAGADGAIVYPRGRSTEDGGRKALRSCSRTRSGPGGADVIFDPVGGDYSEAGAAQHRLGRALPGRRLPGRDCQAAAQPDLAQELRRLRRVLGRVRRARPEGQCGACRAAVRWWAEGRIAPRISATFPLERAGEAIAALRDRRRSASWWCAHAATEPPAVPISRCERTRGITRDPLRRSRTRVRGQVRPRRGNAVPHHRAPQSAARRMGGAADGPIRSRDRNLCQGCGPVGLRGSRRA